MNSLIYLPFRKPKGFEKSFSKNSKIPRFARNDNLLSLFFGSEIYLETFGSKQ